MKENRRPIGNVEYAVYMPHENVVYVYESSHKYLEDSRFRAFPKESEIYEDWKSAWSRVDDMLKVTDPDLYYGVKLVELTKVFAASTNKSTLESLGFDVEDNWYGALHHHADKLLRWKMHELGIMNDIVND